MSDSTLLKIQVTPLQFSDRGQRAVRDITTLFEAGKNFPVKIFTEVGPETDLWRELKKAVGKDAYDHRLSIYKSNAVAIDRRIIKPRSWVPGAITVMDNDKTVGRGHDPSIVWANFEHVDAGVGEVTVFGTHYATNGKFPNDPNYDANREMAEAHYALVKKFGKGNAIAVGGGDFNMPDHKTDWFWNLPLTSLQDELAARAEVEGKHYEYQNTGHGDIDGIWTYDADGRVTAKWFNVLDDRELRMESDHWVSRGAVEIRHLEEKPSPAAQPVTTPFSKPEPPKLPPPIVTQEALVIDVPKPEETETEDQE